MCVMFQAQIYNKDKDARAIVPQVSNRYYTSKNVQCRNCNKYGHLSKNCPAPKVSDIHIQLMFQDKRDKLMCVVSFWANRSRYPASCVAPMATLPLSAPIGTVITAACLATSTIRVPREPIGTRCVIAAA